MHKPQSTKKSRQRKRYAGRTLEFPGNFKVTAGFYSWNESSKSLGEVYGGQLKPV